MAIVWGILLSLGCVLLCGGFCYGLLRLPVFHKSVAESTALSLATLTGFWGGYAFAYQQLLPAFPPVDVSLWWVYSLPILAVLAYRPATLLALGLSGVYAYLLTGPLQQYEWSMLQALGFSLAVAVVMGLLPLGVSYVLDTAILAKKEGHLWLLPWVMSLTSLGSAVLFMLSSSAILSQHALFLTVLQLLWCGAWLHLSPLADAAGRKGLVFIHGWLLLMLWLNMLMFASLSYVSLVGLLALFSPVVLRFQPVARAALWVQCLTVTLGSGLCLTIAAVCVFLLQPQAGVYY